MMFMVFYVLKTSSQAAVEDLQRLKEVDPSNVAGQRLLREAKEELGWGILAVGRWAKWAKDDHLVGGLEHFLNFSIYWE